MALIRFYGYTFKNQKKNFRLPTQTKVLFFWPRRYNVFLIAMGRTTYDYVSKNHVTLCVAAQYHKPSPCQVW